MKQLSVLLLAAIFLTPAASADPPPWAGGKGKGRDRGDDQGERRGEPQGERRGEHGSKGSHFADEHRVVVREYYGERIRSGKCPPGLAKKNNGCMPPGQAKKWRLGRPLPRDVVYYDVPRPLVLRLGEPGPGYRYVRVAADILLIAAGSRVVIDAIQDLGRM